MAVSPDDLHADHTADAVRRRLDGAGRPSHLRDVVYGAIDGTVTTFAVVTGATGADLSAGIILVLGLSNLLADGFSMAVSNYLGTRVESDRYHQLKRLEGEHIDRIPEGEREEVRQIFASKGFAGADLERAVEIITSDRDLWIDTMLREEHGVSDVIPSPVRAGATTLLAFVIVGLLPLLPFLAEVAEPTLLSAPIIWSAALTAVAFAGTGWWKARAADIGRARSVTETLVLGGAAALIAFVVGLLLKGVAE